MERDSIADRTKAFALRVLKMVDALPKSRSADAIARQITRSATSIGANYRAARRGRSKAEFIAKLGIAVEEADETVYWLELLAETELIKPELLKNLSNEAEEILKILAASRATARKNQKQ